MKHVVGWVYCCHCSAGGGASRAASRHGVAEI
jgi:hypothetical protein